MSRDEPHLVRDELPPQKERLVALVEELHLFHDERGRAYARVPQDGHQETWPLGSGRFRSWLARQFYLRYDEVPSSSVVNDAMTVARGQALFEGQERELHNRFARNDEAIWYDLADDAWQAVRIDPMEWRIVPNPPPLFRRYSHQQAQVHPVGGGDLAELLEPFVNVSADEDMILVLVWLVTALVPDLPRAILVPWGPQGSAKSTLARALRKLVDPSAVPMPRFPRGDDEMAQVLDHHAAPFFDNVSRLSQRESDTLCRAVTGDGFSKRKLYSDDDDVLFQFKRAILVNGINVPTQRPDLLDRSILLHLDRIPPENRMQEDEIWFQFDLRRKQIFGAMLDALSDAMAIEPGVELDDLPRMADWTRWGYAVAEALEDGAGETFLRAYQRNREKQNAEALESHPVGAAVEIFMDGRDLWSGRPAELLAKLEDVAERESLDTRSKLWPGAANWLTRRLNEVEPNLLDAGIRYERQRDDARLLVLTKTNSVGDADGAYGTDGSPAQPGSLDRQHTAGNESTDPDTDGMPTGRNPSDDKASDGTVGSVGNPHGCQMCVRTTPAQEKLPCLECGERPTRYGELCTECAPPALVEAWDRVSS